MGGPGTAAANWGPLAAAVLVFTYVTGQDAGFGGNGSRPRDRGHSGAMAMSKQSAVDMLRRMGFSQEADEAEQELPDPVDMEQLREFGDRHGISRDELMSRMGGSP